MRDQKGVWKGVAAGAAGGLAASVAMNYFQLAWSKASEKLAAGRQQDDRAQPQDQTSQPSKPPEDATMKAAGKIVRLTTGRELSHEQKKKAGPIVHFAFGTAMGALYGGISEVLPSVKSGFGTMFGALLFVGADEVAVPASGLGAAPSEVPISSHAYALASHLIYGATTEAVRRGTRAVL